MSLKFGNGKSWILLREKRSTASPAGIALRLAVKVIHETEIILFLLFCWLLDYSYYSIACILACERLKL